MTGREDREGASHEERGMGDDHREESAPRRVGEVRREREAEREAERERREAERGTSWIAALIGMLTALGTLLLLSGIVGGIVAIFVVTLLGAGDSGTGVGVSSLIGVLATLFLSYLMGGYAAGRVASRKGTRHGLLTALLGLVVTVLLLAIGTVVGLSASEGLSGAVLPGVPQYDEQQGLGSPLAVTVISGVLILLVPFVGGVIGGAWGARTGRRRP